MYMFYFDILFEYECTSCNSIKCHMIWGNKNVACVLICMDYKRSCMTIGVLNTCVCCNCKNGWQFIKTCAAL